MKRAVFFLFIMTALGIGMSFVAAQDDDIDIPMPPLLSTTEPEDLIPTVPTDYVNHEKCVIGSDGEVVCQPYTPAPTEDLIPTVPTDYVSTEKCVIGSDGNVVCQPYTPTPSDDSICITDQKGEVWCQYPTMEACITNSHGEVLCEYPTFAPTPTSPQPTLTADAARVSPGYWRKTESTTSIAGTCKAMGIAKGDDDGGPVPTTPLTPICQSQAGDFLFVDNSPAALIDTLLYGTTTSERKLDLSTGSTSGAINTSASIQYQVVNSGLIHVVQTYAEEGGCTVTYDTNYELVQTDASVCASTVDYMETLTPMSTPLTTGTPGTEIAPAETTQLIPPGTYPVTWTMDSGTCTDATQPTFTEAQVNYTNNGDMLLRLGDDEHTLFAIGTPENPRYQFFSSEWQLNVQFLSGVIKLDWSRIASVTSICFKSGELGTPGGTSVPQVPASNPIATPTVAAAGQQYQVSFQPDETMCPQAIQDVLPTFDGATLEKLPDGTYQMVFGSETYAFTDQSGYGVYDGSDLAHGITYQIGLISNGGAGGQLSLTYMTASGQMCLAQMTFAAK